MLTAGLFLAMRVRIIVSCVLLALCAFALYSAFMYVYVEHMFTPVPLLAQPVEQTPHTPWPALREPVRFLHKVNTPARARHKESRFDGFEVDVWGESLLAAHDEREARRTITLANIFAAVKHPGQKLWWLDLKNELSEEALTRIVQTATQAGIAPQQLLFETSPGPTAQLIVKHNLGLLLQLPEGFEQDAQDPATRTRLNAHALSLWQQYRPVAVSASFGKYAYLHAYFPNMPKAIYYSSTKRPSLKKPLMARRFQKDPSVKIFMTDEYTYL